MAVEETNSSTSAPTATEKPTTVLELFWDLASLDSQQRIAAAEKLVTALEGFQSSYHGQGEDEQEDQDGEDSDSDSHSSAHDEQTTTTDLAVARNARIAERKLDSLCAPDVAYSLKRLLRGLPSSREGARQGFAVALTELLARLLPQQKISLSMILDLLAKYTAFTGAAKGQEEKEMRLGRLFGAAATVQAGLIESPSTTPGEIDRLASLLIETASSKAYLTEPSYSVLVSMLARIANRDKNDSNEIAESLIRKVLSEDGLLTFEDLWFAISAQSAFPELDYAQLIPSVKKGRLLASSNLEKVVEVCLESSKAHPRVHKGWECVVEAVVKNGGGNGKKGMGVKEFWEGVVEERLLNSSHERKLLAFRLLPLFLPHLPPAMHPTLLTPSLLRTLGNALSEPSNLLYKAATALVRTASKMGLAPALLSSLPPRAAQPILASLAPDALPSFAQHLTKELLRPPVVENVESHRTWCASQLALLCKPAKGLPEEDVRRVLRLLFTLRFVNLDKVPAKLAKQSFGTEEEWNSVLPPLSEQTKQACGERFLAALADACSSSSTTSTTGEEKQDKDMWLKWAREFADFTRSVVPYLSKPLSARASDAITKAVELAETIKSTDAEHVSGDSRGVATEMLALLHVVRVFYEPGAAESVISDLVSLWSRASLASTNSKKRKRQDDDEEEPEPSSVAADLALELASRPESIWRGAGERMFRGWCGGMGVQAVGVLVGVLEGEEGMEMEEEESGDEEDGEGEEGDEDEDEEDEEEESGEEEEEDDDDDDSSSEVDSQPGGDFDDDLAALKSELAKAMNDQDLLLNDDDGEDSDMELGDEEMEALDMKLAEVFKNRKSAKQEKNNKKRQMAHFKLRVLDLLEIYVKRNGESTALLAAVVPLLQLVKNTPAKDVDSRAFKEKLTNLLKNRVLKARGYGKAEEIDPDTALELVREALKLADSAPDREYLALCSAAALLGTKVAEAKAAASSDAGIRDSIMEAYGSCLAQFFTRKHTPLQASVFSSLAERFPELGWKFAVEKVVPMLDGKGAAKAYPVVQGYSILANAFQKIPAKSAAEYRKPALDALKKVTKAASKLLSGTSDDEQRPEKSAKKNKDKDATSQKSQGKLELNAERKKEVIKALLNMARRTKNLVGDGWSGVKGGLGLDAIVDAVKDGGDSMKAQAGQLLTV